MEPCMVDELHSVETSRWVVRTVALLACLLVAGCVEPQAAPSAASSVTPPPTAPTATPTMPSVVERTVDEMLADLMGWGSTAAELAELDDLVEERIRVCMAKQGFIYRPVPSPYDEVSTRDEQELTRIERRGFGITTWVDEMESEPEVREAGDPNVEVLEAMSDAERRAWEEALLGTEDETAENVVKVIDPQTGDEIWKAEGYGPGCMGEARRAVLGAGRIVTSRSMLQAVETAREDMYRRIEADERVVASEAEWSACMAARGHEVSTRAWLSAEVYVLFEGLLTGVLGEEFWAGDPTAGMTQAEWDEFMAQPPEVVDAIYDEYHRERMSPVDMEALEALQAREIAMAIDNSECERELRQVHAQVTREYQDAFIDENREILLRTFEAERG